MSLYICVFYVFYPDAIYMYIFKNTITCNYWKYFKKHIYIYSRYLLSIDLPFIEQSPRGVLLGRGVLRVYFGFSGAYLCVGVISIQLQRGFVEIMHLNSCEMNCNYFEIKEIYVFVITMFNSQFERSTLLNIVMRTIE